MMEMKVRIRGRQSYIRKIQSAITSQMRIRESPRRCVVVPGHLSAYSRQMRLDESYPAPQFPATRWSIVLSANGGGTSAGAALEEICRLYWFPLYAYARNHGCSPEDAEDETQRFLASVATGGFLQLASPERGKLRTYLLSAFQRDLIDSHRRAMSQKRGGKLQIVSLEALNAEDRFRSTPSQESPTAMFDRAWAMTCLDSAVSLLESEYAARGRGLIFEVLRTFLDPEADGDYAAAALKIRMDPNAVRQAVFRLRQRFRALLRLVVADTLGSASEALIDEELTTLRAALAT